MAARSLRLMPLIIAVQILSGCGGQGGIPANASNDAADPPAETGDAVVSWFTEITTESGIDFVHESDEDGNHRMAEIMGSGCGMFDYDGDGDLDLYLLNGNHAMSGREVVPPPRNRLYRNEGNGSFTDATEASGLGDQGYGFGVAAGDIDNDGDVDVYVTNYGPDRLYRNNGDGTFTNVTDEAGAGVDKWSTSAAFFDYDRDGFLDLYVCRYVKWLPEKQCSDASGRLDYCGPQVFDYETDVLLHNNGDGTFTDVSEAAGMAASPNPALGVVCDDFNGDGLPDIAVANDGDVNFLWINLGDGTFVDMAVAMGVGLNMHGATEAGMGILAEDFDGDALVDLFMTHLTNQTNTLYRNRGDGTFDDQTGPLGLAASSQPFTGFGTAAFDVELDGDLDLLVVNGKVQRSTAHPGSDVPPPWDEYAEPNLLYQNVGGAKFRPVEDARSTFDDWVEISKGLAVGDIDRDGDLDVLICSTHAPARLYRNDAERKGRWLMIEAIDPALNREAIGAHITVRAADRTWTRTQRRAFSYLATNGHHAHFGLGPVPQIDRIEVTWPDGTAEVFDGVETDRYVTLRKGEGAAQP